MHYNKVYEASASLALAINNRDCSPTAVTTDARETSIAGIVKSTVKGLGCIFPRYQSIIIKFIQEVFNIQTSKPW